MPRAAAWVAAVCVAALSLPVRAGAAGGWLAAEGSDPSQAAPTAAAEWTKPVPLSFSLRYTLVSDYIFRGINFSEYAGEGREKLNHQMTAGVEWDTGAFGSVGFTAWFEWYAAQEKLTPTYGGHTQEIDYTAYWKYPISPISTTVETGWIAYTFPPISGDGRTDYEWYLKLSLDDGKLWGTPSAVLNPYLAYYHGLDLARNASWWETGVSHDFALADCGCAGLPVLKDVTITPSLVLGAQHHYFRKLGLAHRADTGLAALQYGLSVTYDLSSALGLPASAGSLTVGGFLNFSEALDRKAINDELYGGMTVGYSW
jgi:hypothetical protein